MKLLIDVLGLQSSGSRTRGIGRYTYSLLKNMLENNPGHEIWFLLNNAFPDSISGITNKFKKFIPLDRMLIWNPLSPCSADHFDNSIRRRISEKLYETFISKYNFDIILLTSVFEGLGDDGLISINKNSIPCVAILYDLIPLEKAYIYLENPVTSAWYYSRLDELVKSKHLLGISRYTSDTACRMLNMKKETVTSISSDAHPSFKKVKTSKEIKQKLFKKYKINEPFIMYTGGIDYRKNIEGLVKAYSILPNHLIQKYQLAIICKVSESDKNNLLRIVKKHKLNRDRVVFTGFVSDEELIQFYNLSTLFVFPSKLEGFGLPVLEAMRCGAPVIGSNSSSIREIIKMKAAMFDPDNVSEISKKMMKALSNKIFYQSLVENSEKQEKTFSWKKSANKAWVAVENTYLGNSSKKVVIKRSLPIKKKNLAYISPLPPEKSGISDYSINLISALSSHYNIELVSDSIEVRESELANHYNIIEYETFIKKYEKYDRVLYQFGNSGFHHKMIFTLQKCPGTVVLHDFFLSGLYNYLDKMMPDKEIFRNALEHAHGKKAVDLYDIEGISDRIIYEYPMNKKVFQNARGVIVHSKYSANLKEQYYPNLPDIEIIPFLQKTKKSSSAISAKRKLGISENTFLICSFGLLFPTKLSHLIVDAFCSNKKFTKNDNVKLIFIGDYASESYKNQLEKLIKKYECLDKISVTGYVSRKDYLTYLDASDVCIQLRINSRGETSASLIDCMSAGKPVIMNTHGSAAELPDNVVVKLKEEFTYQELSSALNKLHKNLGFRKQIGKNAFNYVKSELNPKKIATLFYNTIEKFWDNPHYTPAASIAHLLKQKGYIQKLKEKDIINLARIIDQDF